MANETKEPGPGAEKPVLPRIHFHIVLGLFFMPCLSAGIGWMLAVNDVLNSYATRTQRLWSRLLVALVLVDSLIVMGSMASGPEDFKKLAAATSLPKLQFGIVFEPEQRDADPVVSRPLQDSPAERAGIRSGDRIVSIDGKETTTQGDVIDEFAKSEAGVVRKIVLRSDGDDHEVDVVPEARRRFDLFEPLPGATRDWTPRLGAFLPALVAGVLAWLVGWIWFQDRGWGWPAVFLVLAAVEAISMGAGRLLEARLGGTSVGSLMIAMSVGGAALPALALLASRLLPDPRIAALGETRRSAVRGYFRGLFYGASGAFRMMVLLALVDIFWFGSRGPNNPIQNVVEGSRLGTTGTLLLILDTVLLAPIGEELLFRGFLLPRLMVQKGPVWAIGASAVVFALLHPQYGIYMPLMLVYGVVLGWVRVRTGGLTASILLHLTINAFAAGMVLLSK
ncbi:MAG TPA: CPBP family glutamic-type intramembrane protease [Planctomycetota bacterium]|nr:CPBP family glutamic-type intramembrane protease [Planctomycetota bacterium]